MNKFEDILTFRDGKQAWGNYLIEVSITQYVPYSTTSIVFYYSLSSTILFLKTMMSDQRLLNIITHYGFTVRYRTNQPNQPMRMHLQKQQFHFRTPTVLVLRDLLLMLLQCTMGKREFKLQVLVSFYMSKKFIKQGVIHKLFEQPGGR